MPYTISPLNAKLLGEGGQWLPFEGWRVEMPHIAPFELIFEKVTKAQVIEQLKTWYPKGATSKAE